MYYSAILFLLINTYGGLGLPTNSNGTLRAFIDNLASKCENSFIVGQLKYQEESCKFDIKSPYVSKFYQCLMFYDINSQLCLAASHSKITITETEFKENMAKNLEAEHVCNDAKTWNISELASFPKYKSSVTKVLNSTITCNKYCTESDDLFSEDVNFYCKYFNWAWELLKKSNVDIYIKPLERTDAPTKALLDKSESPVSDVLPSQTIGNGVQEPSNAMKTKLQSKDLNKKTAPYSNLPSAVETSSSLTTVKLNTSSLNKQNSLSDKKQITGQEIVIASGSEKNDPTVAPNNTFVSVNEYKFKPPVEEQPPIKEDIEIQTDKLNKNPQIGNKDVVIENPQGKPQSSPDTDEYAGEIDSDDGKDTLTDPQNPDDDDPAPVDFDTKPDQEQTKLLPVKRPGPPAALSDLQQREMFPNMQDGFPENTEDNFFPVFLTAIVLVVLLYVLYHNKSKVSKVVLGLIVEGRQSGRRRNSRGHSYRRLDTLEQAMNSNAAAAPSRIIY